MKPTVDTSPADVTGCEVIFHVVEIHHTGIPRHTYKIGFYNMASPNAPWAISTKPMMSIKQAIHVYGSDYTSELSALSTVCIRQCNGAHVLVWRLWLHSFAGGIAVSDRNRISELLSL